MGVPGWARRLKDSRQRRAARRAGRSLRRGSGRRGERFDSERPASPAASSDAWPRWLELLAEVPADVHVAGIVARGFLVLLLVRTTWWMLGSFDMAAIGAIGPNAAPPTFVFRALSGANLIFHEAGHVLFGAFGRFLQVLGGSMLEAAVPWICALALYRSRRDTFGASIAAWWGGEALVGLGPYIYDAREQVQPLLGGVIGQDRPGYHDWNNLLSWTGLLPYDHAIAGLATTVGYGLMLVASIWSCWLLQRQFVVSRAPSVDGFGALD